MPTLTWVHRRVLSEFERQRTERWLDYDSEGATRAIGYTVDNARRHEYYLARRLPR